MRKFVEQLKKDKTEIYVKDYHEMVAAFNRENSTTSGYNGRQILELLQNCDDQKSESVLIELDIENNILNIANQGVPFSEDGYRSLATSDLSSKIDKTQYIGNKGLGFRSILNWVTEVNIFSNGLKVSYSEEIKENAFSTLFDEDKQKEIREKYRLSNSIYPLPILSVPNCIETDEFEVFATVISLHFKADVLKDINDQIRKINAETILFLHHIKNIKFKGFAFKKDIYIERDIHQLAKGSIQNISSEEEIWDIFQDENKLPDEFKTNEGLIENYQIRIAVPRVKPKTNYYLYSFFSTNIVLHFPYIIHATFDLDQNRKHLANSKKNKIVIEKLTQLMCKMALYKAEEKVDWSAYLLLQYNSENENLKDLNFYDKLNVILKNEKIIPCVSNEYHSLENTVFIDNEFSKLLKSEDGGSVFQKHIQSLDPLVKFDLLKPKYNAYLRFVDLIEKWSLSITDNKFRARLIKYLVTRNISKNKTDIFNIFINDKGDVIEKQNEIFTHLNDDYVIPDYCLIDVISPTLFNDLIIEFNINESSKKDRARTLQTKLKHIGNIHSFESLPLAHKIVNNTNHYIIEKPDLSVDTVKKMLIALFHNFDPETTYTSIDIQNVPIIDKDQNVTISSLVYFSDFYFQGQLCRDIFGEIHNSRTHIANPVDLGLNVVDTNHLETFLNWLGVNQFVKYSKFNISNHHHPYVVRTVGYVPTTVNVQVSDFLQREEILKKITPEQFLLWVIKDLRLSNNLNRIEKKHGEVVNYKYHSQHRKTSNKSYLYELIENNFYNFSNHLLDNTFKSINEIEINYGSELFKKYEIKRRDIDDTLKLLGAVTDFNDLSIERVQEILEKLNIIYENGRNTSAYYRRAYLHFEENGKRLTKSLKLFARDDMGLRLYNQEEIYFSDKVNIPSKLRAAYPVFNFPKRSGGKKAIDFFRINDLSEIKINLESYKNQELTTKLLSEFLMELYPYILIYRINALDNEKSKHNDASKLQKIKIHVCTEVITKVESNLYPLQDYEFIFLEDSGYFLKLPDGISFESIRNHSSFKDAISEILSHLFDVSGHKADFRSILSTDFNDVKHLTKVNFGDDLLDETLKILGFSNSEINFWSNIYRLKGKELTFKEENILEINQINEDLVISIDSPLPNYDFINDKINYTYLNLLFSDLSISIREFNEYSINQIDLYDFHLNSLINLFINKFNIFKQSLHCNSVTFDSQKEFLQRLHDYEVKQINYIENISLENRYVFAIAKNECFENFIKKEFKGIDLIDRSKFIDIENIYNLNKSNLDYTLMEIVEKHTELKSLLHFEIEIDKLKKFIFSKIITPKIEPVKSTSDERKEIFNEKRINSFKTKKWTGYKNRKDIFNPNNNTSLSYNFQTGKTSEEKVYHHLCSKYGNDYVHYKAKEDEGLHYDIRYSPDKGEHYKYVEVKTFSTDNFIISREEYEFGKEKKEFYEIWLVRNNDLIIFNENLEEIDLVVKDYYVAFSNLEIV
ncbi:DUF3883 domain-containing protein [Flavobacterium rakeshii]|uniref:DUF3883 domain-containing protein n=1 Tax=Flavobacterium rakeshii TaxID=1038845 RepID=A0A6N8HGX4_9FLAO|nr:DUF3883 domain-containing protein [Flavobacterium rakeshii]MUV04994.1 DUF3883 domain-containing protein [Flavobacterium rakeshii]